MKNDLYSAISLSWPTLNFMVWDHQICLGLSKLKTHSWSWSLDCFYFHYFHFFFFLCFMLNSNFILIMILIFVSKLTVKYSSCLTISLNTNSKILWNIWFFICCRVAGNWQTQFGSICKNWMANKHAPGPTLCKGARKI